MKTRKVIIIVLLFIITILVLSLHIIELARIQEIIYTTIDGNSTTIHNYISIEDTALFFGKSVKVSLLYDICLYAIMFLIMVCVILVAIKDD